MLVFWGSKLLPQSSGIKILLMSEKFENVTLLLKTYYSERSKKMAEKYLIIATSGSSNSEVIDYASNLEEAQFYAKEYSKELGIKTTVTYKLNPEYQE